MSWEAEEQMILILCEYVENLSPPKSDWRPDVFERQSYRCTAAMDIFKQVLTNFRLSPIEVVEEYQAHLEDLCARATNGPIKECFVVAHETSEEILELLYPLQEL